MLLAFEGRERAQQSELEGMWKLQESKSGIGLREMRTHWRKVPKVSLMGRNRIVFCCRE
jgi:hypothetical protein